MRHGTATALKDALRGARHGMAMGGAFVLRFVKIVLPPIGYLDLRGRAMRTESGMWRRGIRISTIMSLLCLFTACASTSTEDDLFFVSMVAMSQASDRERLSDPRIRDCPDPDFSEQGRMQYINLGSCVTDRIEIFAPHVMNQRLMRGDLWTALGFPQRDVDGLDGAGDAAAKLTRIQNFSKSTCQRFIVVPGTIDCVRSFRTRLDYPLQYAGLSIFGHPRGPCRQGRIRFTIEIPNQFELRVKEIRFESVQPCS